VSREHVAEKLKQSTATDRQTAARPPAHPLRGAGNAAMTRLLSGRAEGDQAQGRELDSAIRTPLEAAFGTGFTGVRVQADSQQARATGATAMTVSETIHMAADAPALESRQGQALLAHELSHVVHQRKAGAERAGLMDSGSDAFESDAGRASAAVSAGITPQLSATGAPPAIQRQSATASPVEPDKSQKTTLYTTLADYLDREWDAQSKRKRPFVVNAAVRKNLGLVWAKTPLPPNFLLTNQDKGYETPTEFLEQIKGSLPSSVDAMAIGILKRSPDTTKQPDKIEGPKPDKTDDAAIAAAKEALQEFLNTKKGQELAQHAKRFVLSKDGIPFDFIVVEGIATAVIANDAEIPGLPEIPLPGGISIKVELKRKAKLDELPQELQGLFVNTDPNRKSPEGFKAGLNVEVKADADDVILALGTFFSAVGRGIAAGAIAVGTVIGKAAKSALPFLAPILGGAALGALIGGLAGGWIGAGIGAAIGAGVGLIASLAKRLFS
jgi:hypothetical protein